MTHNEASWDRIARVVLGAGILSLVFVGPHTLWGLLGFVPLATGAVGFCPLYRALGINSNRKRGLAGAK
jgi:hypothetical protein